MKKLFPVLAISSSVLAAPEGAQVIYGADGRKDIYEAPQAYQLFARSTPTMISASQINVSPFSSLLEIDQTSLDLSIRRQYQSAMSLLQGGNPTELNDSNSLGFCSSEKFISQPNPGSCSGFLIAPDLVVTAGHCTEVERACEDYKWVFDFKLNPVTQKAGVGISPENVYSCKKIIRSSLSLMTMTDFAVIQLDRKVKGRDPLKLRLNGKVSTGEKLVVVGNPSGLPLKVTEGGAVRTNNHLMYFDANLDTYQGNSGSAVFNARTHLVEGILVRGENDFVFDQMNGCLTSYRCPDDGCRGESVSRIGSIPEVAFYDLMFKAVMDKRVDVLNQILDLGIWVDFNLANGETILMRAASLRSYEMVDYLLSRKANPNATDAGGNSALHHLAKSMSEIDMDTMHLLISEGGDLNLANNKGQTPSMVARQNGNYVISLLLDIFSK
jgi:hypothetical protein